MQFIDRIPFPMLIVLALLMLAAPFVPEPHIVQKLKMLSEGTLTRPLDIFDVFWHLLPSIILVIKVARLSRRTEKDGAE